MKILVSILAVISAAVLIAAVGGGGGTGTGGSGSGVFSNFTFDANQFNVTGTSVTLKTSMQVTNANLKGNTTAGKFNATNVYVTNIVAGSVQSAFKSSDGTAGATATTGGATFREGLYTGGTISGSGGSATNLTPWTSDINGAGFSLTNAGTISAQNLTVASVTLSNAEFSAATSIQWDFNKGSHWSQTNALAANMAVNATNYSCIGSNSSQMHIIIWGDYLGTNYDVTLNWQSGTVAIYADGCPTNGNTTTTVSNKTVVEFDVKFLRFMGTNYASVVYGKSRY